MIQELLYGAYHTLSLAVISWLIGLPTGILLSFLSLNFIKYSKILTVSSVFFIVTPFIAILFWFHYPLQNILNVVWPPYFTSAFLLSLYVTILTGEIFANEMRRIKDTYTDAADVLGLKRRDFISKIIFPSASLNSLPRMLNLGIVSIHMTMFASLIGVEELFRVTLRLNAEYLQPVELFTLMAILYSVLCLPLYFLSYLINRKLKRSRNA